MILWAEKRMDYDGRCFKVRKLDYRYQMELLFEKPVNRHHFTLRCLPYENERQLIKEEQITICPEHTGGFGTDSFGNRCIYGRVEGPHERFFVDVTGMVQVDERIEIREKQIYEAGLFRYPTKLTGMGKSLRRLFDKCSFGGKNALDQGKEIMDKVFEYFRYEPGATQVDTTAEKAAAAGRGVCQDYAHVMLALCRELRLPCRYVAGMMVGEGASHAWVEICDGTVWTAFDPTNNCMVDDRYISMAYGRDAGDSPLNQGDFYGASGQKQEVHVTVEEHLEP